MLAADGLLAVAPSRACSVGDTLAAGALGRLLTVGAAIEAFFLALL